MEENQKFESFTDVLEPFGKGVEFVVKELNRHMNYGDRDLEIIDIRDKQIIASSDRVFFVFPHQEPFQFTEEYTKTVYPDIDINIWYYPRKVITTILSILKKEIRFIYPSVPAPLIITDGFLDIYLAPMIMEE